MIWTGFVYLISRSRSLASKEQSPGDFAFSFCVLKNLNLFDDIRRKKGTVFSLFLKFEKRCPDLTIAFSFTHLL